MQPKLNSEFTRYEISDGELENGTYLNYLQKGIIQNRRADIASEILNLTPDDYTQGGLHQYHVRKAYLKGQLDILTHLLESSDAVEAALQIREQSQNQGN